LQSTNCLNRYRARCGHHGEKWIWTSRQKTDSVTHVPLLPPALEILDRYKDDLQCADKGRLLPVFTNQKMNSYLKEIADVVLDDGNNRGGLDRFPNMVRVRKLQQARPAYQRALEKGGPYKMGA
jgi:hypothetical protein